VSNQKKIWVGFVCVCGGEREKKNQQSKLGGDTTTNLTNLLITNVVIAQQRQSSNIGEMGWKKKGFSKYKLISNIVCVEEGKTRKHNYYHYYLLLIFFYFYFNFFCFFRLFFKNNKSIATQKKLLRFAQFWLLIYTFLFDVRRPQTRE
jgi:hypothetical protein